MKAFVVILVAVIAISGCSSMGSLQYTNGLKDISGTSDETLVWEATIQASLVNSLFASENNRKELRFILDELKQRHPDWYWSELSSGTVVVGMTELEAILSWGYPTSKNIASYGDQWVYRKRALDTHYNQYLYFDSGILTGFN